MTQTGWIHLAILLLVFAGVVAFALPRMILPAPKEGAQWETIPGANGYGGGYNGGYRGDTHDGGHGGIS